MRIPVHLRSVLPPAAAAIAFFLSVSALQRAAGSPQAAFGGFPDEAAHFIGGVLAHDYMHDALGQDPKRYAIEYYVHIPYFAIGPWPPFYYLLEGAWVSVAGARRESALGLVAVMATLLLLLFYFILRRRFGEIPAWSGCLLLLSVPAVQWSACLVMIDIATSLFALVSLCFFVRFLDERRWQDSLLFGIFGGIAILTKNSAYYITMAPPLMILLGRRWDCLKSRALWLAPLAVAVIYAPWLLVSRQVFLLGLVGLQAPGIVGTTWNYLLVLWPQTSFLMLPAAIGALAILRRARTAQGMDLCMLSLLPAVPLSIYIARMSVQERLLIPAYASVVYLACEGFLAVLDWSGLGRRRAFSAAMVLTAALFCAFNLLRFPHPPVNDIHPGVAFIQGRDGDQPGAVLVPSAREGPWIAEFVQTETARPRRIFVRPTKILSEEDWNGADSRPFYHSVDEIAALLERMPLRYIVLERGATPRYFPPDKLLTQLVGAHPERWRKVFSRETRPVSGYDIYENTAWSVSSEEVVYRELHRFFSPRFR